MDDNFHLFESTEENQNFMNLTDEKSLFYHLLFANLTPDQSLPFIKETFAKYSNTLNDYAHKRPLLALYALILLLGTFANLILIYTIRKLRNPKSLANRRMLLIRVFCDLALAWFGVPYTAYTAVYKNWHLGNAMCKISAFVIYFIVASNNFLLVAICLNRSVAICQNDKRLSDSNSNVPCRVKFLLVTAGLLALTIAFPGSLVSEQVQIKLPNQIELFILNSDISNMIPMICQERWSREAQLTYDISLIVAIYVIPLLVVCCSQHIVTVHLKQSQRLLMLSGHRNTLAYTRRRQRLNRLCVFMAGLFVLSWSPNHVCNLLTKAFHINHPITEILLDYSMCLALSNSVTGPLLLIFTCSNYHRYILRLFCSKTRPGNNSIGGMPAYSSRSSVAASMLNDQFTITQANQSFNQTEIS